MVSPDDVDDDDEAAEYEVRRVLEALDMAACLAFARGWDRPLFVESASEVFDRVVRSVKRNQSEDMRKD